MPPVAVNPNPSRASRSAASVPAAGVPVAVAVDANCAAAPQAVAVSRPAPASAATQPSSTQVAAEAKVWLTCARLGPLLTRAFDAMRAIARYAAISGASARHLWPYCLTC